MAIPLWAGKVTEQMTERLTGKTRSFSSAARLTSLGWHFGGCGMALPFYERISRHKNTDPFSEWLTKFIHLLNVDIKVHGELHGEPGLFVSNHVSWLDPILLYQLAPFSFIAKEEVQTWPIIGTFSQKMKVVFIERTNKFSVYRSLPTLETAMNNGNSVLFFPEGTTTRGHSTAPFFPMLFETSVRTQKPVQPMIIRYTDLDDKPLPEVAFVENDSVFDTLFRMLKQERIIAHIHLLKPILPKTSQHGCRKRLANRTKSLMDQELNKSFERFSKGPVWGHFAKN